MITPSFHTLLPFTRYRDTNPESQNRNLTLELFTKNQRKWLEDRGPTLSYPPPQISTHKGKGSSLSETSLGLFQSVVFCQRELPSRALLVSRDSIRFSSQKGTTFIFPQNFVKSETLGPSQGPSFWRFKAMERYWTRDTSKIESLHRYGSEIVK